MSETYAIEAKVMSADDHVDWAEPIEPARGQGDKAQATGQLPDGRTVVLWWPDEDDEPKPKPAEGKAKPGEATAPFNEIPRV